MANVNVNSQTWTQIGITSGTVQNISATADVELSAEQTNNSGVVLKPSEIYQWDNKTIYARAVTEDTGALRVVNFKKAAGGGGGYVLPVASSSTLGGVKVGNNLSIDASGVLSANSGGYTLPPATTSTLGGVIIGENVTVDANGEISVAAPYSLPKASASTLGGVKIGSNVNVDSDGVISVAAPYSLPTASADTLGGVKVGSNLSIDENGVLSASGGGGGGGGISYSTTEQEIGTWINGKPLYQLTVETTTPSESEKNNVMYALNNNLNIDKVVYIDGYIMSSEYLAQPINVARPTDNSFTSWIYCGTTSDGTLPFNIRGEVGGAYVNKPAVITIRYTKTTD